MSIYLHQDFLVGMPLLDLFAEFQAWIGKVAHIHNHKIVLRACRNHGSGRVQVNCGINVVTSHPQHQSAQMLYGAIAINKQDTGFMSRSSHLQHLWLDKLL
jgi:hypothetical protein